MSDKDIKPPVVTQDPGGWTRKTYADGNWSRTRKVGTFLECQYSWDPLAGTPQAVREQDTAAAREAAASRGYAREKAFWDAFLGRGNDERPQANGTP